MKSYEQRTENITKKANGIRSSRKAWVSVVACMCCLAIVCGILLSVIPSDKPSDINAYEKSDYFPLIKKIYEYNERLATPGDDVSGSDSVDGDAWLEGSGGSAAPGSPAPDGGDKYEETTLNQVDGVTEGDLLKRSKNYAFYLTAVYRIGGRDNTSYYKISAYSISGKDSALVGEFDVKGEGEMTFDTYWSLYNSSAEMYLSEDAKTLTLVSDCYYQDYYRYTCVVSLDVSKPSKMAEKSRVYVSGHYLSSRKVNGELLLVTNFYVPRNPDFDKPDTFLPSCGTLTDREYWRMEEIYCPEYISECTYTVVAKINESNLKVTSKQAVLSYTYDVAVSTEHIFIIRNRGEYVQNGQVLNTLTYAEEGTAFFDSFSEIVCLEYSHGLKTIGCVKLEGNVKDRYWLDEKDGIMRVVTQTMRYDYTITHGTGPYANVQYDGSVISASLHCVDLAKLEVVASVENFAPNGETVQAVRFNGDSAYVCTAIVNTDPVFVFDLSDIKRITYKDTGTIPGYSLNLIQFGDYLLGIGYVGNSNNLGNTLKIELYKETDSKVESVAIYEKASCSFSAEYKAQFIDAEHQLVGLQIADYGNLGFKRLYLLLQFDTETQTWRELLCEEMNGRENLTRAFYADGFYLIGNKIPLTFFSESELFQ